MSNVSGLFGDWDKFERVLYNLRDDNWKYQQVAENMAKKIQSLIQEYIYGEELALAPLVQEYRERKAKDGYGDIIEIRTADFVNSIQITNIQSDGNNLSITIGVEGGQTQTGIDMTELAQYIEYGTKHQIARPVFMLSWEKMRGEIAREISSKIKYIIEGEL